MKKTKTTMFILIGLTLTFAAGVGMYSTMTALKPIEYVIYGAIGLVALFALIRVFKNLRKEKKGLTTEDELSQTIKLKAGADSFTYSFYSWTLILLATLDNEMSNEILLGIGIAAMALIFVGFYFYHNTKGVDSANAD